MQQLHDALARRGDRLILEKDAMRRGDSIAGLMERLAAGRCVLLILSAAYLRSEYCMTEPCRIWQNAGQRGDAFCRRMVPPIQDDACIRTVEERGRHTDFWMDRHDALDGRLRKRGHHAYGTQDFATLKRIADFVNHVRDMLQFADDMLIPRDRPTLAADDFAAVCELVDRALSTDREVPIIGPTPPPCHR